MVKRLLFNVYLYFKGLFGTRIEGTTTSTASTKGVILTWIQEQEKSFLHFYNVDREDRIDYTNTKHHFDTNYGHLDDANHPEFGGALEQVGLLYESDQKTPKNAAEVFDMTYEEYLVYKKKILPHAKNRKITLEEIQELFD